MPHSSPPPLPWEPGGRPYGKPPPLPTGPPRLPWEQVSNYPGYQESTGTAGGTWIPVGSSNVSHIRWVEGNDYPLQVRFLAKDGRPASEYGYAAPETVYDSMLSAASMGRYVHHVLRQFPYTRLA